MSIHLPVGINDALTMLDSRVPLTAGERKMIVEGLYDLAYKAGERAERLRIKEAVEKIFRDDMHMTPMVTGEYQDPTTTIRRKLEHKNQMIRDLTHNSPGQRPGWDGMTNTERKLLGDG